jgi:hypothetical protein
MSLVLLALLSGCPSKTDPADTSVPPDSSPESATDTEDTGVPCVPIGLTVDGVAQMPTVAIARWDTVEPSTGHVDFGMSDAFDLRTAEESLAHERGPVVRDGSGVWQGGPGGAHPQVSGPQETLLANRRKVAP